MPTEEQRPNPDELLERVQRDAVQARRGKLKIFFGASPGVGKTYAMLQAAQRLHDEHQDVVVGIVESHGRHDTAALLQGLAKLPRKEVHYHNHRLLEFDLDAALKRHPAILLVDELAHTNAPGSRHTKRWQDIDELLAAGINVFTTINVQHIESLNDVVGGITGIRVHETVPDHVFRSANEVILIDLPPDDLLLRLKEGKVYLPEQAERAIQNFFRKGNLIALRELALRQTADRVDNQMLAFRGSQLPVWQTRDYLLACVGPSDIDEKVVRAAARLAAKFGTVWHAVYVETPTLQRLPDTQRQAILKTLKLANELGAVTETLTGQDRVEEIINYARRNNLGRLIVGRSVEASKFWETRASFSQQLGRQAPDIDLVLIARQRMYPQYSQPAEAEIEHAENQQQLKDYVFAALSCFGIAIACAPLAKHFDTANIVMLFLLGVVFVAYRFGRGPSVLAAILSVALFDFFFVVPHLSFAVSDVQYLLTFLVMLIVGLVTGHLTAGLRYQARVAYYREERARSLYQIAKALASSMIEEQVVEISDKLIETTFHAKVGLLLPNASEQLQPPATHGGTPSYDLAIAQWCYDKNEPAGTGTATLSASPQLYLPLKAPMRVRGVLVVEPHNAHLLLIPEQRRLLETFAALVAIALERIHFVSVAQDSLVQMESERLRNSLLAALSHDLRTPLTALVGLAETLSLDLVAAESKHIEKVDAIREQALRTSHMVNNLLEMARLQSGEVKPRKDWQSLEEIVGSSLRALNSVLSSHPLQIELPNNLPLIKCDAILIERVLVNLLENASKYTQPDTRIGIQAQVHEDNMHIEIWDEGPGLPVGQERAIFTQFTRGQKESVVPGVGLGLTICEAIIEAHDGKIWAENRAPHGARFIFTLPMDEQPSVDPEL